jgi:hypothetical protein
MASLQNVRSGVLGAIQGVSTGAITLLSGRCVDGYVPFLRVTGSGFPRSCYASESGPLAIVRHGSAEGFDVRHKHPRLSVDVDLYVAIDGSAADDLSGMVSFVEKTRRGIDDALSFGGASYPDPNVIDCGSALLFHYRLECRSLGCDPSSSVGMNLRNESDAKVLNETDLEILVA